MPKKVMGYSGRYLGEQCSQCSNDKLELVQVQAYIGIGSIKLFGVGPREFANYCEECGHIGSLTEAQIKKAKKLKYAKNPPSGSLKSLRSNSENKSYPVMDEEKRSEIRKSNLKEGFLSLIMGIIIGLIIIVIPNPIAYYAGILIIAYSIIGGLYAAFEDPEKKHRDLHDGIKTML